MLMKLTTGVNFINILQAAFAHADPKSVKNTDNLTVFLALSRSPCIKVASKMLMKLTTGQRHVKGIHRFAEGTT